MDKQRSGTTGSEILEKTRNKSKNRETTGALYGMECLDIKRRLGCSSIYWTEIRTELI